MTAGPAGAFVGRTAERLELSRQLSRAATASIGGFVLVSGEAGIGKTALAEQAAVQARELGFDVAWAACWQTAVVPPLQPWLQLIAQLDGPDAVAPDLAVTAGDLHAARFEQAERVSAWLRRRSPQPTLLVLDDLQWADSATLSVLGQVVTVVRAQPVVVIATHRAVDPGARTFADSLADLRRAALTLPLAGLDERATAELVSATTGHEPSTAATRSLVQLTGGNPLFTRELSRTLSAEALRGRLDPTALVVPTTVRAIVIDRLATVSDPCRSLLELLSVAGDESSHRVLGALVDVDPPALLELLDEAAQAGLVESGSDTIAFAHALFRAAVYESLPSAVRVRWHDRIGRELLVRRERGHPVDVAALAHHFGRAAPLHNNSGPAFGFALEAARDAVDNLSFDLAARRYEQALAMLSLDPGLGDRVAVMVDLADARAATGDHEGARRTFRDAAAAARRLGNAALFGRAALGFSGGMGGIEVLVGDREVCELLEAAAGLLADDDVLGPRVDARRSIALSHSAPLAERIRIATGARDRALAGGDPSTIAEALAAWCDVVAGPDRIDERRAASIEIIGRAAEVGDAPVEALGRRHLVEALLEAGDLRTADIEIARFELLASRLGRSEYAWYPWLWRASLALARGDLSARAWYLARLRELVAEQGGGNAALLSLVHDTATAFDLEDPDLAGEIRGRVSELIRFVDDVQLQVSLARLHAVAGESGLARELLDRWLEPALAADQDSEWAPMMMQLAELVVAQGGHPAAGRIRRAIEPHGPVWVIEGIGAAIRGPLDRVLGGLAALDGDRPAALHHFDAARRAAQGAGAEVIAALVDHDEGVLLGDERRLAAAAVVWRRIGAAHRLAATSAGPASAPPGPPPGEGNRWVADGDGWSISYAGVSCAMSDRKGLRDLARLLAEPGREIAALDLASPGAVLVEGDTGEVIDERARDAYRARLTALEAELDEADERADAARSATLSAERDALVAQLSAAFGLGGRVRRSGRSAERARTAVRSRISDAIARLEVANPALGRHLARSIRTGTFCVYDPDPPVEWDLGGPPHTV